METLEQIAERFTSELNLEAGRVQRGIETVQGGLVRAIQNPDRFIIISIHCSTREYIVDLRTNSCGCRDFAGNHICYHFIAAKIFSELGKQSPEPQLLTWDEFCEQLSKPTTPMTWNAGESLDAWLERKRSEDYANRWINSVKVAQVI